MNYRELKWGALRSYASKLGVNTKGMPRELLLEWLDAMPDEAHGKHLEPFKGIKQKHPLFKELEPYIPHLKAYKKVKAISPLKEVNEAIATLFVKYIETQKNVRVNLGCGICRQKYYERMIAGYNKLVEEYGGAERI